MSKVEHSATLSQMSVTAVQDFYRTAYMSCRLDEGHFPSARSIQELVQAWKQKGRWKQRLTLVASGMLLPTYRISDSDCSINNISYFSDKGGQQVMKTGDSIPVWARRVTDCY